MTLSNNSSSNDSFGTQLEQERRALWQAHAHWSEEIFQQAWSTRLTELLLDGASVPRNLQYELGGIGTSPAQQGADQGRLVGGFLLMDSGRG